MKAVVLEIRDGHAAVLRKDGIVQKIKQEKLSVGDTIELRGIPDASGGTKILSIAGMRRYGAIAAAVLLFLGLGIVYSYYTAFACAYVSMDVNPSLEFGVNRMDRVISVEAVNEDAEGIAAALKAGKRGVTLSEALADAWGLLEEEAYVEADAAGYVLLNVSSDDPGRSERLLREAAETLSEVDPLASTESGKEGAHVHYFTESSMRERAEARSLGISAGEYQEIRTLKQRAAAENDAPVSVDASDVARFSGFSVADYLEAAGHLHASSAVGPEDAEMSEPGLPEDASISGPSGVDIATLEEPAIPSGVSRPGTEDGITEDRENKEDAAGIGKGIDNGKRGEDAGKRDGTDADQKNADAGMPDAEGKDADGRKPEGAADGKGHDARNAGNGAMEPPARDGEGGNAENGIGKEGNRADNVEDGQERRGAADPGRTGQMEDGEEQDKQGGRSENPPAPENAEGQAPMLPEGTGISGIGGEGMPMDGRGTLEDGMDAAGKEADAGKAPGAGEEGTAADAFDVENGAGTGKAAPEGPGQEILEKEGHDLDKMREAGDMVPPSEGTGEGSGAEGGNPGSIESPQQEGEGGQGAQGASAPERGERIRESGQGNAGGMSPGRKDAGR